MAAASHSQSRWPLLLFEVALATCANPANARNVSGVPVANPGVLDAVDAAPGFVTLKRGHYSLASSITIQPQPMAMMEWTAPKSAVTAIKASQPAALPLYPAPSSMAGAHLALAVTLNGVDRGIVQLRQGDGGLWGTLAELRKLGMALPATTPDPVRLDRLAGVEARFHEADQSLDIVAPVAMLDAQLTRANYEPEQSAHIKASPGAVLGYDVQASFDPTGTTVNAMMDLRAFAGPAAFDSTELVNSRPGGGWSSMRFDTSLALSFPDKRLTLKLGDTVSSATSWSRSTRMGGVQFGTNFALQPYLITTPVPAFFGSATLPSRAEIYVNGMRRYAGDVPPGPFEIGVGPARIDGAGMSQLVLTDVLGRVTNYAMPIYETPQLLRPGLSEWSVELGAVRRNYGLASFDYDPAPVASGTWRKGLTSQFTFESHAEVGGSIANFGVGGVFQMGMAGVISGSVAASQSPQAAGTQLGVGYSWSNGRFNMGGSIQRASRNYADVATANDALPPRVDDVAHIGYSSRVLGYFGLNYLRLQSGDQPVSSYAGVFLTRPLGSRFSLNVSANQNLETAGDRNLFLTLSVTPGARTYASAAYDRQGGTSAFDIMVQRSTPLDGGVGWSAGLRQAAGGLEGDGQFDWLGHAGELCAGLSRANAISRGYLGYSGSLVLIDDRVFIGRRIADSFAVVTTGGVPNVPVSLENRTIGKTNGNGELLITGLNAYQHNRIGIDPAGVAAGYQMDSIAADAMPANQAGVVVHFPIRKFSAVEMTLVDGHGAQLPAGTPVSMAGVHKAGATMPDGDLLTVGFDGQLYIESPQAGAVVFAETPEGPCHLRLPANLAKGKVTRLGKIICEAGQ